MRFAYSTNAFKRHTLHDAVTHIADLGFEGVELLADRPHLYPEDFSSADVSRLHEHIREKGLAISNLNTFTLLAVEDMHHPSWIEKEKERRDIRITHTRECIRLAHELGCPNISVQPGGKVEHFSRSESLKLFIDGLSQVLGLAKEYGITVLVEPEPDLLIETAEQFQEFITMVDDPSVGLNCDIGHFVCSGDDPAQVIHDFAHLIGHVHIEDIKDRVHDHKICGEGDIDFARVFKALRAVNYTGFISVELYPYQDQPIDAGRASLAYLRRFS